MITSKLQTPETRYNSSNYSVNITNVTQKQLYVHEWTTAVVWYCNSSRRDATTQRTTSSSSRSVTNSNVTHVGRCRRVRDTTGGLGGRRGRRLWRDWWLWRTARLTHVVVEQLFDAVLTRVEGRLQTTTAHHSTGSIQCPADSTLRQNARQLCCPHMWSRNKINSR